MDRSNGQAIILQMLRQHFVFQKHPRLWFRYMDLVDEYCEEPSKECSDAQLKAVGVADQSQIEALAMAELT